MVFTCPSQHALRVPLTDPANGRIMHVPPPPDIIAELGTQTYTSLVNLIAFKDRMFYEGVTKNDGWNLVAHLRTCQANEGGQYEFLKEKRESITCPTLAHYPKFKTQVLQMKVDYARAIANRSILPDEDWSLRSAKEFVCDTLQPLLGNGLAEWNADPEHTNQTLAKLFEKASSIYKAKARQLKLQRDGASTFLHHDQDAQQLPPSEADMFYNNSARDNRGHGRGYPEKPHHMSDRGAYDRGNHPSDRGARPSDRNFDGRRQRNSRRLDDHRRSSLGGKGSRIASALVPMITAAIIQAISAGQVPFRPPPHQPPRHDHKRPRTGRDRGVRQYVCDQADYDETDYYGPPDNGFEEDHQQYVDQSNADDFGSEQ